MIYWYRDYWSNRRQLGRNIQSEKFGWKNSDFDIKTLGQEECVIERNEDDSISVKDLKSQELFTGLVNPQNLLRQYEPHNILIRERYWGRTDIKRQTPQDWYLLRLLARGEENEEEKVLSRPHLTILPTVIKEEPIARMKGDFKTLSPRNPLFGYPIALIITWLVYKHVLSFIFRKWVPWLEPILFPLMILAFIGYTYLFVFSLIDDLGLDVRDASEIIFLYNGEQPSKKHYRYAEDIPSWLGSKPYWVFRYMYLWRGELTTKKGFPPLCFKPDWERVEVWLDARSGIVEWIVTDYHWRELWYEVEQGIRRIYVWILPNFHTPRPLTIKLLGKGELRDLYRWDHILSQDWIRYVWKISVKSELFAERARVISSKIEEGGWTPGKRLLFALAKGQTWVVTQLIELWWRYWRYSLGADNEKYKEGENSPDWIPSVDEQPPAPTIKNHPRHTELNI